MGRRTEGASPLVILTREPQDNLELRLLLEAQGLRVLESPCIETRFRPPGGARTRRLLAQSAVAAFTSRRAALACRPAAELLRAFPGKIAARGGATAAVLAAVVGRTPDIVAEGHGAAALARAVAGATRPSRVLHVCGDRAREELAEGLREAGYETARLVVYETRSLRAQRIGEPAIVVFASPSAVESFFAVNAADGPFRCLAIGATTEGKLKKIGAADVSRSPETTARALADQVFAMARDADRRV